MKANSPENHSNNAFNWANFVTIARICLAFVVYALLLSKPTVGIIYWCFVLTILVILGDYLDGKLARNLNQSSKLGAWLDIAADRLVEICYWIVFACLHWVSPWISIVFVARGLFVDGIRSMASAEGFTAFGETSMMKGKVANFVVASRFSRGFYALSKMLAFCLVIFAQAQPNWQATAIICVYVATFMCLIRGLPVLIEGTRFFKTKTK
jgi:phosphatidylglycerophosphate synthase